MCLDAGSLGVDTMKATGWEPVGGVRPEAWYRLAWLYLSQVESTFYRCICNVNC
jgi:hypothetical protein